MTDQSLSEFYSRIARIEKARAKGYGFEAEGTLGRSYYYRPTKKRRPILAPLLMVAMCSVAMKGAVLSKIGDDLYEQRVDRLLDGQGFERLGGYLMKADPVTVFVSDQFREFDI
ncbi:MAG: hypothetical protein WCC57_08120 [Paracoccaceae bacterium]